MFIFRPNPSSTVVIHIQLPSELPNCQSPSHLRRHLQCQLFIPNSYYSCSSFSLLCTTNDKHLPRRLLRQATLESSLTPPVSCLHLPPISSSRPFFLHRHLGLPVSCRKAGATASFQIPALFLALPQFLIWKMRCTFKYQHIPSS